MQTEELKLIERIQKLHNMAESARALGSLAEADSFMDAVQKTLAKYNLDASVLTKNVRDLRDPLVMAWELGSVKRYADRPSRWTLVLASAVADAHHCALLTSPTSSHVWFCGRETNVAVTRKMYVYLRDLAEATGWKAYQKVRRDALERRGSARGLAPWYLDWLEGFAVEVRARYLAMRARLDADTTTALVPVNQEAKEFARQSASSNIKRQRASMAGDGFREAHERGREAGKTANLRPNVLATDAAARARRIGA